jgi:hypothetical protein
VSGLLIALGLFGPVGPALMLSVMIVAAVSVHLKNGLFAMAGGIELALLYGAAAAGLALTGPGQYSLDALLGLAPLWTLAVSWTALAVGIAGWRPGNPSTAPRCRRHTVGGSERTRPPEIGAPMSTRPVKGIFHTTPHVERGVKPQRAPGSAIRPSSIRSAPRRFATNRTLSRRLSVASHGIETITHVLAGQVKHGDSLRNAAAAAGDVQWMTAGSGILHQEMPQGDAHGRMHGFQLWANLPSSLKMTAPRYQDVVAKDIPEVVDDDGTHVRVICGDFWGQRGPIEGVAADPRYVDISVPPGRRKRLTVDTSRHAFAYVFAGSGHFATPQPRAVQTDTCPMRDPARADCGQVCPAAIRRREESIPCAVRQRRRSRRPGRRRRHPVPAGFRQAARGTGGVVWADRHEHSGAAAAGDRRAS